jgi:hypothetical protein
LAFTRFDDWLDVVEATLAALINRDLVERCGEDYRFQVEVIRQRFAPSFVYPLPIR